MKRRNMVRGKGGRAVERMYRERHSLPVTHLRRSYTPVD
jgi:hypothetical protein